VGRARAARRNGSERRNRSDRRARAARLGWPARSGWANRSNRVDRRDRSARFARSNRSARSADHLRGNVGERNNLHIRPSGVLQRLDVHFAGEQQHRERTGHESDVVVACRIGFERPGFGGTSRSYRSDGSARSARYSRSPGNDGRNGSARSDWRDRSAGTSGHLSGNVVYRRNVQHRRRRFLQRLGVHLAYLFKYE
jgi:hypothetical protein